MMNIVKLFFKSIVLILVLSVVANMFWPDLVEEKKLELYDRFGWTENESVLGARTINALDIASEEAGNFIARLPIFKEAEKAVVKQVESIVEKPKNDIEKVRGDIREKVCGEWLR